MHAALAAALTWGGCAADRAPCALAIPQLVVVTTDYQSGILAATDPFTGATCDERAVIGPDAAIRSWDGEIALFDRTGGTSLRLYAPAAYDRPLVELGLEPGANVHDVAPVGDELWLAPYERTSIVRLTRAGAVAGTIDLRAHADADGLPEIDRFVRTEDGLYVALQRLDRDAGWSGDAGRIVRLDPLLAAEDGWWDVGPNPKVYPDPSDPRRVIALTGRYFVPDGALEILDPEEGVATRITEAELGYDLAGFAGIGEHAVLLGVDFELGRDSRIACFDLATGALLDGDADAGWFVDAVAGPDRVYVASRTGWAGDARDRILDVDPVTCAVSELTAGFALDPFALAYIDR